MARSAEYPHYSDFKLEEELGGFSGAPFPEPDHLPTGPQQSGAQESEAGPEIRAGRAFQTQISGPAEAWV